MSPRKPASGDTGSSQLAKLTLDHLRRIGRYEASGGTVLRYDGWRGM